VTSSSLGARPASGDRRGTREATRPARFEGRGSTRDGRGSRRHGADAVAVVASAFSRSVRSPRSSWFESAVAPVTGARDREVRVLAPPLDPAGSIRVHVVVNDARRVLGDRARRPRATACIASGVARSRLAASSRVSSRSTRSSTPACGSRAARSRVSSRSPRSKMPASRGEARHAMAVARAVTAQTPWRSSRLRSVCSLHCSLHCSQSERAVATVTRVRDGEVRVLAPPLDPAGSIRVHVVVNDARRVLGDRARRPRATACIASGVVGSRAPVSRAPRAWGLLEEPAKQHARLCPARRELAGLIEEHAKRDARFEGRGSTRDGRGSRRHGADAVAVVASAFSRSVRSPRSSWFESAVAPVTGARDREVRALAPPLDPAGSIRVHVVVNDARRVLGDRARRPRATACIASGVARSRLVLYVCREIAVHSTRRELAGLIEEPAKQDARFEGRGSTRDGRGSRRHGADAVAVVASAFSRSVRSPRSSWFESAVAPVTGARDREVRVLAPPLDPAGSIRVHVVVNDARRVLGDRARRPRATACIASGVVGSRAPVSRAPRAWGLLEEPAKQHARLCPARRELAGLIEEPAKRDAREAGCPLRGERLDTRWPWLAPSRRRRRGACRVCVLTLRALAAFLMVRERRGACHRGARPRGPCARTSPRSCREHSRSCRRERRATRAR
jgi:hypothetical protein